MEFRLQNENIGDIKLVVPFWAGKSKLFINDKECTQTAKNEYILKNEKGENDFYRTTGNIFTGLNLVHKAETVKVISPLSLLEWILCMVPIILVFLGGAIGGALGAVALMTIMLIVRKYNSVITKIIFSVAVWAVTAAIYIVIAEFLLGTLNLF